MPRAGFEPTDPSNQAAADLRLRPRGPWDRQYVYVCVYTHIHTHTHIYIYIYLFIYITLIHLPVSSVGLYIHHQEVNIQFKTLLHTTA
jgi:hypothetical protein